LGDALNEPFWDTTKSRGFFNRFLKLLFRALKLGDGLCSLVSILLLVCSLFGFIDMPLEGLILLGLLGGLHRASANKCGDRIKASGHALNSLVVVDCRPTFDAKARNVRQ